jgi:hypothetical protein
MKTRRAETTGQLEYLHYQLAQVKAAIESLELLQRTRERRMRKKGPQIAHIEGYLEAA